MEPVTFFAGMLISRLLAPVVNDGWKKITNADAKEERKRLAAKAIDFKNQQDLKSVDLQNQLTLQRSNHELRLQEAQNSHQIALERWGIETYYKNCWPLRNPFEMQICEPISNDKNYFDDIIVPCRLISALKDSDHPYAKTINGNLSSFVVNYYPTNSLHAVVSEIGAWKEDSPSNDASVNYLYAGLKKQPVMIMAPAMINNGKTFIFKVWSWGLGEELNYPAGFEFGRLELKPLYLKVIYEETMAMVQLAKEMEYAPKLFSANLRHNISIIKEIQDKKATGNVKERMLSFLHDAPEIDEAVKTKMEANISGIFCCIAGMYADAYHLLEYKTLPKLPTLLPNIPGVEYMLPSVKEYYYTLLSNLERIENDKNMLANIYLDVADAFSRLNFSFANRETIIEPFTIKGLSLFVQTVDSNEDPEELKTLPMLRHIIKSELKYQQSDIVVHTNEIFERVKIAKLC